MTENRRFRSPGNTGCAAGVGRFLPQETAGLMEISDPQLLSELFSGPLCQRNHIWKAAGPLCPAIYLQPVRQ